MIYFESVQTSSKKMTNNLQKRINDQFFTLVADISTPSEARSWLTDFMTETEVSVFAKRLAIAEMLMKSKSYQEIKDQLKVSSATISSVSELTNKPGIKLADQKIKLHLWAEKLISKILPF